jgi:nitrogen fixation/metabolism regulation signal transduction histidine kinase
MLALALIVLLVLLLAHEMRERHARRERLASGRLRARLHVFYSQYPEYSRGPLWVDRTTSL